MPSVQPVNISKRGLTQEQEEAPAQRIRSDFIDQKKFCPLQMVQRTAMQIHRESQQMAGDEGRVVRQEDGEFLPFGEERRCPFKGSGRRWATS
jgi:hypothetical protein